MASIAFVFDSRHLRAEQTLDEVLSLALFLSHSYTHAAITTSMDTPSFDDFSFFFRKKMKTVRLVLTDVTPSEFRCPFFFTGNTHYLGTLNPIRRQLGQRNREHTILELGTDGVEINIVRQAKLPPELSVRPLHAVPVVALLLFFPLPLSADPQHASTLAADIAALSSTALSIPSGMCSSTPNGSGRRTDLGFSRNGSRDPWHGSTQKFNCKSKISEHTYSVPCKGNLILKATKSLSDRISGLGLGIYKVSDKYAKATHAVFSILDDHDLRL
ncbi:hypothetical protein RJ639_011454 [Escallonia herrerae]|uniref:Uncharacterized protein n=1 Tax=Escallonia herrerae TaxID=1293975 RepID=A0AA88VPX2_9ASTE|nr:hypothetical protein RJ639_011454 [Escallonia herrerae]